MEGGRGGVPKEWKVIIRHTQITLSSYEIFRLYGLDDVEFNLNPYFLECLERQSFLKTVGGGGITPSPPLLIDDLRTVLFIDLRYRMFHRVDLKGERWFQGFLKKRELTRFGACMF